MKLFKKYEFSAYYIQSMILNQEICTEEIRQHRWLSVAAQSASLDSINHRSKIFGKKGLCCR